MLSNILYVLYCLSPGSLLRAGSLVGTGPLDSRSLVGVDIDANAGADLDSAGFFCYPFCSLVNFHGLLGHGLVLLLSCKFSRDLVVLTVGKAVG